MATVKFHVGCIGIYQSELDVPEEIIEKGEVLKYIREHLSDAPCKEIDWLEDLEPTKAVEEDDIIDIN